MDDSATKLLSFILLIIDVVNIMIHVLGLYLLLCLYKGRQKISQHLFLINLSISSLIKNTLYAYFDITNIVMFHTSTKHKFLENLYDYVYLTFGSVAHDYYLLSLFYLTCDRLMVTIFHVRYSSLWSLLKTKVLLTCTAFLLLTIWLTTYNVLGVVHNWNMTFVRSQTDKMIAVYIPTSFNLLFLFFATIAYYAMFSKFRTNRRISTSTHISSMDIFRRSRFHVAVLLLTSSLVLVVLPNLLFTISTTCTCELLKTDAFGYYFSISVTVSDGVDGLIYVMCYNPVTILFKRKFKTLLLCRCSGLQSLNNGTSISVIHPTLDPLNKDPGIRTSTATSIGTDKIMRRRKIAFQGDHSVIEMKTMH